MAAQRLRPRPSGVRCGGGELGPPPSPDSGLGSPARGRGRGRSARAGSPRLLFLVPGKSSLRGLAASRSRCCWALAWGSAAGAAPPLGAPQCRAPSLPTCPPPQRPRPGLPAPCNPDGARAGPGKPRGGVGTGRARRALCSAPHPRPGCGHGAAHAPGSSSLSTRPREGRGLGLLRRPLPRPRPGLAARGPDLRDARGDHAEQGPALLVRAAGAHSPQLGPGWQEAWVWEGVARWVVGGGGEWWCWGDPERSFLCRCVCECVSLCVCDECVSVSPCGSVGDCMCQRVYTVRVCVIVGECVCVSVGVCSVSVEGVTVYVSVDMCVNVCVSPPHVPVYVCEYVCEWMCVCWCDPVFVSGPRYL